jgi:rhodanese-related sulfurtransferase
MTTHARRSTLTLNQKLALAAFTLALPAVFAQPYRGNVVTLNAKELAAIIDREDDHVGAAELAGWIVEGRSDYRLIDLRSEKEYAEYHVPTAENVSLASLPGASLARNEKIVLYSDGGLHASQAWMLMRGLGFTSVYTIKGGLEQWKQDVLFPSLPESARADARARFEKAAALARFFGGAPRTGDAAASAATPALALPKLEVPAAAPPAGGGAVPKKKKEGC